LSIRSSGAEPLQLQFNAAWYQRWTHPRSAKDFAMETEFSTTKATVNEAVTCRVKITRSAFRGYGTMIAEVGLPPGVEVDRGKLASVTSYHKSGVDSFEVAPDHVTFYVWPQASDSDFQFVFRPRFAMKTRMTQSVLYDYYNPDERALLMPQAFSVN
jgi:A-macroglobulin receptor binding domain